jgi:hypothetical protein
MYEPPHVHVIKDGKSLKVWLQSLEVASNNGYTDRDMARLLPVIAEHRDDWIDAWNDFFGV